MPDDLFIPPEYLQVILEEFEGPLDLLLYLIRKQNIDVSDLPIFPITEQYMNYISIMEEMHFELASDYLVMASWLTLLKSQLIIPDDELKKDDADKINELLALRLQRLAKIRENATWLFDRPQLFKNFFPSSLNRDERVIKEDFLKVQLADILKAYVGIVDKRNYEVPLGTKEEYLFLDKAISFIEQKVKGSKALISFPNLVKEIHALSGIEAKRCAASIFCGLLEYTKLGKIQIKQENAFSSLELAKVSNGKTV